ncbi:MAG: ribonuclease Z [Chlamydiales bacterium]|jgi:ribonuclease Z
MVDLTGLEIHGVSIGGIETCLEVPEYKLAFDIGRCPPGALLRPTVLFTHAHIDHLGGIASHAATRALRHMPPPTYIVPPHVVPGLEQLFDAWRGLDGSELPHRLVPLAPGESWRLAPGRYARPFQSIHRSRCQGYGIWSVRHKLKPEYAGADPTEIRDLRQAGTEVTNAVEVPELAFIGDSQIEVVERESVVRQARRLILETTFVDERVSVEECRSRGHIHLDEVAERADLFENEAILLTHFSARYRPDEILEAIDRRLPESLRKRVQALLPTSD